MITADEARKIKVQSDERRKYIKEASDLIKDSAEHGMNRCMVIREIQHNLGYDDPSRRQIEITRSCLEGDSLYLFDYLSTRGYSIYFEYWKHHDRNEPLAYIGGWSMIASW